LSAFITETDDGFLIEGEYADDTGFAIPYSAFKFKNDDEVTVEKHTPQGWEEAAQEAYMEAEQDLAYLLASYYKVAPEAIQEQGYDKTAVESLLADRPTGGISEGILDKLRNNTKIMNYIDEIKSATAYSVVGEKWVQMSDTKLHEIADEVLSSADEIEDGAMREETEIPMEQEWHGQTPENPSPMNREPTTPWRPPEPSDTGKGPMGVDYDASPTVREQTKDTPMNTTNSNDELENTNQTPKINSSIGESGLDTLKNAQAYGQSPSDEQPTPAGNQQSNVSDTPIPKDIETPSLDQFIQPALPTTQKDHVKEIYGYKDKLDMYADEALRLGHLIPETERQVFSVINNLNMLSTEKGLSDEEEEGIVQLLEYANQLLDMAMADNNYLSEQTDDNIPDEPVQPTTQLERGPQQPSEVPWVFSPSQTYTEQAQTQQQPTTQDRYMQEITDMITPKVRVPQSKSGLIDTTKIEETK
jgi:hypothetical protein